MMKSFCVHTLLFALPVMAAAECEGGACSDDDVNLVQLTLRKPVRNLAQHAEQDEVSNLLQGQVHAANPDVVVSDADSIAAAVAVAIAADPHDHPDNVVNADVVAARADAADGEEGATEEEGEDGFVGQWHDDHHFTSTITRDNARWGNETKWYKIVSDDPEDPFALQYAKRISATHVEMLEHSEIFLGELEANGHHLHWHRAFGHEEWQKYGYEEEDTRYQHGSQPDAAHPLIDYEVTKAEVQKVTPEEFETMDSIQHQAQLALDDAALAGNLPPLVPIEHQPNTSVPEDQNEAIMKTTITVDDTVAESFAQSSSAESMHEALEQVRAALGDEAMVAGEEKVVSVFKQKGFVEEKDMDEVKHEDPSRVMQALIVMSSKLGQKTGELTARKIAAFMKERINQAV